MRNAHFLNLCETNLTLTHSIYLSWYSLLAPVLWTIDTNIVDKPLGKKGDIQTNKVEDHLSISDIEETFPVTCFVVYMSILSATWQCSYKL